MEFKVIGVELDRKWCQEGGFFLVGYKTKTMKEIGKVEAKNAQIAAQEIGLKPYLVFSFLPAHKFKECLQQLKNGSSVIAFLIEAL